MDMKKLFCNVIGHNWIDIRNEVIMDGEMCLRCGKFIFGNEHSKELETLVKIYDKIKK